MNSERPSTEAAGTEPAFLSGTVIRSTGSWYDVQTAEGVVPSRMRGKFRLEEQEATNPVTVGDHVTIRLDPDDTGLITEIHERQNMLSRRAAGRRVGREHIIVANVDVAWAIQAVRLPTFNPGFVDRFLVMAEANEIPAGIVINKIDLLREKDREDIDFLHDLYADLGYTVLRTSITTGDGVNTFADTLQGKISVLAGPSGVGKSSLLNAIEPGLGLRVGEVSKKTRKGKHTTTYVSLLSLERGGYVVDTPGIREFGIIDLEPADLGHYFVEFKPFLHDCRFPNCTHDHEPGCAVQAAVDAGHITEQRYYSYLNILDSIKLGDRDVGR